MSLAECKCRQRNHNPPSKVLRPQLRVGLSDSCHGRFRGWSAACCIMLAPSTLQSSTSLSLPMVLQRIRSALDRLSIRALLQRFDKRQLQSQIDTHKLYLLTRLHADRLSGRPIEPF